MTDHVERGDASFGSEIPMPIALLAAGLERVIRKPRNAYNRTGSHGDHISRKTSQNFAKRQLVGPAVSRTGGFGGQVANQSLFFAGQDRGEGEDAQGAQ